MESWDLLAGSLLKENRLKAGLTQRALARQAGIAQSEIARIEGGKIQPSLPVLGRLLDSIGLQLQISTTLLDNRFTAAKIAASVAAELPDEDRAFRSALVLSDDLAAVTPVRLQELVVEPPPLTHNDRFDALIAAIVEDACVRAQVGPPRWVDDQDRKTDDWLVSGIEALADEARKETPPAFARHGVFVLEGELTGV